MNNKNLIIVLMMSIFLLGLTSFANAADCVSAEAFNITSMTQTAPATDATISGSSVTLTNTYIGNSSTNVTFYISNSSGTYVLGADTTVTACNGTASITFDSTTYADGTTYQFNASAYNTTTVTASSTATTGVTIDNTAPTACTVTTLYDTIKGTKEAITTATGTDAIDASVSFVQNMTTPLGTEVSGSSTSTATYLQENFIEIGDYIFYSYCTDNGANTRQGNVTLTKRSVDPKERLFDPSTGKVVSKGFGFFTIMVFSMVIMLLIIIIVTAIVLVKYYK